MIIRPFATFLSRKAIFIDKELGNPAKLDTFVKTKKRNDMAKIVKLHPENQSADDSKKKIIDSFNKDNFTTEIRRQLDELGITKPEELFTMMKMCGIDIDKIINIAQSDRDVDDVKLDELQFDDDNPDGEFFRNYMAIMKDENDKSWDDEDNGDFGFYHIPKGLFIENVDAQEYHIRIKLNRTPLKIWRELKVPSNMSMELLAKLLIIAMGWEDEHLHQFAVPDGRHTVYYKSTRDLKQEDDFLLPFFSRSYNSDKTPISRVLTKKGKRIRFEYDFGDSWEHDVWVKGIRDYNPGETPKVTFVKGQGQCPPEDCGGVWGYEELLELCKKKRKSAEDRERLEWYGIDPKYFDPDYFDAEEFSCEIEAYMEEVEDVIEKRKKESSKKM